jgi:hypothetical protein
VTTIERQARIVGSLSGFSDIDRSGELRVSLTRYYGSGVRP